MLRITIFAVACCAALLTSAGAQAQSDELSALNLFISPCGEPFTAPKTDPYPVVKWFNRADANHDGKLDMDEMRADAVAFFKVLDVNHDGVISSQEVDYYERTMVPVIIRGASVETGIVRVVLQRGVDPIVPSGAAPGDGVAAAQKLDPNQGAVPYSLLREPEPVRSADRNFDYKISLQEFMDHSDRHFRILDVNKQGYLLLAELPKTQAEIANKAHR